MNESYMEAIQFTSALLYPLVLLLNITQANMFYRPK